MTTRELIIDVVDVALSANMTMTFGPVRKDARSPLLGEAQKWDAAWLNTYPTAVHQDGRYKLWYNAIIDCGPDLAAACPTPVYAYPRHFAHQAAQRRSGTLYAESMDGIVWETPALGLVPWGANGSRANNIVLSTGEADANRGVFLDEHDSNATRRFKAFGSFDHLGALHSVGSMVSADGLHWEGYQDVGIEMGGWPRVRADTGNQLVYDQHLRKYLAFTRVDCRNDTCGEHTFGLRREARSVSRSGAFEGGWAAATNAAKGLWHDEFYSMAPWRNPSWRNPALYLAIASFYNDTHPTADGKVRCELVLSSDHGASWRRVAAARSALGGDQPGERREIIPLGAPGAFDDHTCFAAPPIRDASDPAVTRLYYAGGNGPHSGKRANSLGLATAATDGLVGQRANADGGLLVTKRIPFLSADRQATCIAVLTQNVASVLRASPQSSPDFRLSVAVVAPGPSETSEHGGQATAGGGATLWTAEAQVVPEASPRWMRLPLQAQGSAQQRGNASEVLMRFELSGGIVVFAFEPCPREG